MSGSVTPNTSLHAAAFEFGSQTYKLVSESLMERKVQSAESEPPPGTFHASSSFGNLAAVIPMTFKTLLVALVQQCVNVLGVNRLLRP